MKPPITSLSHKAKAVQQDAEKAKPTDPYK